MRDALNLVQIHANLLSPLALNIKVNKVYCCKLHSSVHIQ